MGGDILKRAAHRGGRQVQRSRDFAGLFGPACQLFVDLAPGRRDGVERHLLDDLQRGLAVDPDDVEAGEQALEGEPDASRPLGAVNGFDLAAIAVAVDAGAELAGEDDLPLDAQAFLGGHRPGAWGAGRQVRRTGRPPPRRVRPASA